MLLSPTRTFHIFLLPRNTGLPVYILVFNFSVSWKLTKWQSLMTSIFNYIAWRSTFTLHWSASQIIKDDAKRSMLFQIWDPMLLSGDIKKINGKHQELFCNTLCSIWYFYLVFWNDFWYPFAGAISERGQHAGVLGQLHEKRPVLWWGLQQLHQEKVRAPLPRKHYDKCLWSGGKAINYQYGNVKRIKRLFGKLSVVVKNMGMFSIML